MSTPKRLQRYDRRFTLLLDGETADRLTAAAQAVRLPPATYCRVLIAGALAREGDGCPRCRETAQG